MEVVCQCERRSSHKQRFVLKPSTKPTKFCLWSFNPRTMNTSSATMIGEYLEITDSQNMYQSCGYTKCCTRGYTIWLLFRQDVLDLGGTISDDDDFVASIPGELVCAPEHPCTWCVYTRSHPAPVIETKPAPISDIMSEPVLETDIDMSVVVPEVQAQTVISPTVSELVISEPEIQRRSSHKQRFVKDVNSCGTYDLSTDTSDYGRKLDSNSELRFYEYLGISVNEPSITMYRQGFVATCCSIGSAWWFLFRQDVLDLGGTISDNGKSATLPCKLLCAPEHPCTWCVYNGKHLPPKIDQTPPVISELQTSVVPVVHPTSPRQVFDFDSDVTIKSMTLVRRNVWEHYNPKCSGIDRDYNRKVLKYFGVTSADDSYDIWYHTPCTHGYWHLLEEDVLGYGGTINGNTATIPKRFKCTPEHKCTWCIFYAGTIDQIQSLRVPVVKSEPCIVPTQQLVVLVPEVQAQTVVKPLPIQVFDFYTDTLTQSMTLEKIHVWERYGFDKQMLTSNDYNRKVLKRFGVTSDSNPLVIWLYCPPTHGIWHLLEEDVIAYGGTIDRNKATIPGRFQCTEAHRCSQCAIDRSTLDTIQPLRVPVVQAPQQTPPVVKSDAVAEGKPSTVPVSVTKPLPIQEFDFDPEYSFASMTLDKRDIFGNYSYHGSYAKNLRKYFGVTGIEDSYSIWRYDPCGNHGVWYLLEEDVIAYGGTINGNTAIIPGRFGCVSGRQCSSCIFTNTKIDDIQPLHSIPKPTTESVVDTVPISQVFDFDSNAPAKTTMTLKEVDIWAAYSANWLYPQFLRIYFGVTGANDSYSIWQYSPEDFHGVWDLLKEDVIRYGGTFDGRTATIPGRFKCTPEHRCTNCMLNHTPFKDIQSIRVRKPEYQTPPTVKSEVLAQTELQTPPTVKPDAVAEGKPSIAIGIMSGFQTTPPVIGIKRAIRFTSSMRLKVCRTNGALENCNYDLDCDSDNGVFEIKDAIQSVRDKLNEIEQKYC